MLGAVDQLGAAAVECVRPAAQAGAQVLYLEVLARVPVAKAPHRLKGREVPPGALKRSIYQAYSADNSNATHATYHVSWNARKAPHGHLVEYGTSHSAAKPFLRPAFDAKEEAALQAAKATFEKDMQTAIAEVTT